MNNPWRTFSRDVSVSELNYMRSQGMNNKQIAEKLNVSPSTIGRYLESARKPRTKMTEEDYKTIIKFYEDGYSPRYIAEDVYHCAVATIYRILRENGFEFSRGRKKADIPEKVEEPEEVIVEPSPIVADEQPKSACLTMREVKIYSGHSGDYLVDPVVHTIRFPEVCKVMDKRELGFYIRDLMAVWKEM